MHDFCVFLFLFSENYIHLAVFVRIWQQNNTCIFRKVFCHFSSSRYIPTSAKLLTTVHWFNSFLDLQLLSLLSHCSFCSCYYCLS